MMSAIRTPETRDRAWRLTSLMLVVLGLLAFVAVGCSKPAPLDQARKLLDSGKIDEAATLLEGLHSKDPKAFEPLKMLGEVAAAKKDYAGVIKWYEEALKLPEGQKLKRLFRGQILEATRQIAKTKSGFPDEYEKAMAKAAKLEAEMRVDNATANAELFKILKRRYDTLKDKEEYEKAIEVAKKIGDLYYDASEVKVYTHAIKRLEGLIKERDKKRFIAGVVKTFDDKLEAKLAAAGAYDAATRAISLTSEFTVPEKTDKGIFDPASEQFEQNVATAACLGVGQQFGQVLNELATASPLGRALPDKYLDKFVSMALDGHKAGWKTPFDPKAHRRSAAGLIYTCTGSLPVDLIAKNFHVIKRLLEKEAAAKSEKKPEPKAAKKAEKKAADKPVEKKAD